MSPKSQSSFLPLQAPKTKTKHCIPLKNEQTNNNKKPNSQQQRNSSNPSEIRQGRGQIPKGIGFCGERFKQWSPGAVRLHWPECGLGMQPGWELTPLPGWLPASQPAGPTSVKVQELLKGWGQGVEPSLPLIPPHPHGETFLGLLPVPGGDKA